MRTVLDGRQPHQCPRTGPHRFADGYGVRFKVGDALTLTHQSSHIHASKKYKKIKQRQGFDPYRNRKKLPESREEVDGDYQRRVGGGVLRWSWRH